MRKRYFVRNESYFLRIEQKKNPGKRVACPDKAGGKRK